MQNILVYTCKMLTCAVCDHGTMRLGHTHMNMMLNSPSPVRQPQAEHLWYTSNITLENIQNKLSSPRIDYNGHHSFIQHKYLYISQYLSRFYKLSATFHKISWNVTLTKNPKHDRWLSPHVKYRFVTENICFIMTSSSSKVFVYFTFVSHLCSISVSLWV